MFSTGYNWRPVLVSLRRHVKSNRFVNCPLSRPVLPGVGAVPGRLGWLSEEDAPGSSSRVVDNRTYVINSSPTFTMYLSALCYETRPRAHP